MSSDYRRNGDIKLLCDEILWSCPALVRMFQGTVRISGDKKIRVVICRL
jgi:hypothetical protein